MGRGAEIKELPEYFGEAGTLLAEFGGPAKGFQGVLARSRAGYRYYIPVQKENDSMKTRLLVLSLLCFMGLIFLGAPALAQNLDDGWVDEEVAPPAPPDKTSPPVPPPPEPAPQTAGGGRWPWTSERMIRPGELASLSLGELELMRNEIYARHGWIFRRPDLQNYFGSQPWYRPRSDNAYYSNQQVEAELTPIERRMSRSSPPGKMP